MKILEILGNGKDFPELELLITHKTSETTKEGSEKIEKNLLLKKKNRNLVLKDYATSYFGGVREVLGLKDDDYLELMKTDTSQVMNANGKGGSLLMKLGNDFLILKTVHKGEGKTLLKILPDYLTYIKSNPDTLLTRIYGEHKVHFHSKDLRFMIMNNFLFSNNVKKVYDLKGSTVNRKAKEGESIQKDLDILEEQRMINIGQSKKTEILKQIEADCTFLENMNIMDYSLIIGIEEVDPSKEMKFPPYQLSKYQMMESTNKKEVYYIGIIDVLQNWNLKKKTASAVKSIKNEKAQLSTVSPKDYSKRFRGFITKLFN